MSAPWPSALSGRASVRGHSWVCEDSQTSKKQVAQTLAFQRVCGPSSQFGPALGAMIVAGDGNAYLPYSYFNNAEDSTVTYLVLLRVSPDGSFAKVQLDLGMVDTTCSNCAGLIGPLLSPTTKMASPQPSGTTFCKGKQYTVDSSQITVWDQCWSITSVPGGGVNRNKERLTGEFRTMWSKEKSMVLWSGRMMSRRRISNCGLTTMSTC